MTSLFARMAWSQARPAARLYQASMKGFASEASNGIKDMLKSVTGGEAMKNYNAFFTTLPVQWGEMDSFNHVNNVYYLRYAEACRIAAYAYLHETIGQPATMSTDGIGYILASTSVRYRAPLTYPDEIVIGLRHKELGDDHVTQSFGIFSVTQGRLAAEVEARVVFYDYVNNKKASIPTKMRQAILDLDAAAGHAPVISQKPKH